MAALMRPITSISFCAGQCPKAGNGSPGRCEIWDKYNIIREIVKAIWQKGGKKAKEKLVLAFLPRRVYNTLRKTKHRGAREAG
jgi:hypothetical protein